MRMSNCLLRGPLVYNNYFKRFLSAEPDSVLCIEQDLEIPFNIKEHNKFIDAIVQSETTGTLY